MAPLLRSYSDKRRRLGQDRWEVIFVKETESMRPQQPMSNPLGSSYPVDVLAQLESDALSREVFNAMPRDVQLSILQHNTMTPEALRHFVEAGKPRPSPITALLGEDANSRAYFRTASSKVKHEVWQEKFAQPEEGR